jgi:phage FluMu protein Com
MTMGVYPFRCNSCNDRFWASIWLFSIWKYAKCPRCLNLNLTDWPKRRYRTNFWSDLKTALGAQKHRCSRCRLNFISFRPRSPEVIGERVELDDVNLEDESAVPSNGEKVVSEPSQPGQS